MVGGWGGNRQALAIGYPLSEFWPDQGKGANYAMKKTWGKASVSITQINVSVRGEEQEKWR